MAEAKPLSVSKVIAGVGGALLVASFFLPLASAKGRSLKARTRRPARGSSAWTSAMRNTAGPRSIATTRTSPDSWMRSRTSNPAGVELMGR